MTPPILLDFPDQFESERLFIRCPRPGDGRMLYEAVKESLDSLRQQPASLPWAMAEPSLESAERFCREGHANFLSRKDLPLLLFLKDGRFVGGSGLHRLDWSVPKFEIGYWCRSSLQNRGLITEAVQAVTTFAFDTLHARRIEILTDDLNAPSCRVCERAGFALEGTMRNERIDPDGTLRNTRIYARVR